MSARLPFAILATALAVAPARASCIIPSAAEKAICTPDAHRLCADQIPAGQFAVLYCLKANRSQLGPACAALLARCGQ